MARFSPWPVVVLLVVAVTGAIGLAQPLGGDQSLFLIGAKEMAQGAVLYRDFWDLKQPGIFYFYYVAGTLGGFSAFAVYALELVYALVFAVVLRYAMARSAFFAPAATLVPLLTVALYFVGADFGQQVQVEALSGFPIFLATWLACEGTRARGPVRYLLFAGAGVAAGCVLVLKLIFAPLLVALFAIAIALPSGAYRSSPSVAIRACAIALAGAAVPVIATLASLAHGNALDIALATWFKIPPRIVAELPMNRAHLFAGIAWFVKSFAPAIVLGIAGFVIAVRSKTTDALARCCAVWIAIGTVTILAQRTSLWDYQWLLVSVPVGAFAAAGLVALLQTPRAPANLAILAVACLAALLPARIELRKLHALATHGFALRADDRERYRGAVWPPYAGALHDAALLPPDTSVYVMGDPVYYVVTDRTQPLVLNGWALELLLPEQRDELLRELQARPPAYIYVSDDDAGPGILLQRSVALAAYIAQHYPTQQRGVFGTLSHYSP